MGQSREIWASANDRFMSQFRARESVAARAVVFAILTACCSGGVRGAGCKRSGCDCVDGAGPAHEGGEGAPHSLVDAGPDAAAAETVRWRFLGPYPTLGHHPFRHESYRRSAARRA